MSGTTLLSSHGCTDHPYVYLPLSVVALESTIVAHGMPYPQNLELAKDVSQILRSKGVVPATIAIKDGVFKAGLHPDEMINLAKAGEEGRAVKCSTRDLPLVASKYYRNKHNSTIQNRNGFSEENVQWGATTVAATMRLAHSAGIATFVTGGTGGVHRGGELSLDISTDLIELSRTPVVVVSAGVKSILDIRRTLEVLETFGVPTGTWQSDEFPSFFSPTSGVQSPARFEDAMDVACAYLAGRDLGMTNGMLVCVPNHDPAGESVEAAIHEALLEAEAAGIEGRDITPFILRTVAEKTAGDSLRSNISLVKNNAAVGAEVASAISTMSFGGSSNTFQSSQIQSDCLNNDKPRVVCVGGSVIDTVAKAKAGSNMIIGTSNPGTFHRSDGGVGRNVAEVLGRLGSNPLFYTAIGNDTAGKEMISRLQSECGVVINSNSLKVAEHIDTAQYFALLDHNSELVGGIADMDALTEIPIPSVEELTGVEYLVLDANAPIDSVIQITKNAVEASSIVCFEPTSVPKARQLCQSDDFLSTLSYTFPNADEAVAMAEAANSGEGISLDGTIKDEFAVVKAAATILLSRMRSDASVVITLGKAGVLLSTRRDNTSPEFNHFPADVMPQIHSSNGPGDTFCGAFVHSLSSRKGSVHDAVRFAMKAAVLSLNYEERAISPEVSSLR